MNLKSLKLGEKILFGIFGLLCIFAVVSFIMLEVYRSHLNHPMYPNTTHFDFTAEGKVGSELFREKGCPDCHRALRNGTNHGVILDGIGSRKSIDYIEKFLKKPESTYETKTVDHGLNKQAAYVAALPDNEIHAIAIFLSELKATQGSADARLPMPERSGFVDEMVKVWAPSSWKGEYRDLREEAQNPSKEKP
ncbi:MAG: cytochrome c [Ferrovum sp.]|nr:cytochrome c [Ferrovum sp.]NDU86907.1 cytochrome c [Ferrovum sp.]